MININMKDEEKWKCIREFHMEYSKKIINKKIEEVKKFESSKIKQLFSSIYTKKEKESININENINNDSCKEIFSQVIKYLDVFIQNNLNNIILGKKKELIKLSEDLDKLISQNTLEINPMTKSKIPFDYDKCKALSYRIIEEIISYKDFQKKGCLVSIKNKEKIWNRNELLYAIDLRVCPYCNRQYITAYIDSEKNRRSTADADHYYPQSKYPLLALSLYNIIPSCQICNRTFKGNDVDEDKNTLYPYEERSIINELNFKIDITRNIKGELNCNMFYNADESDLEINLIGTTSEAENSKIVFKLKEVYQVHNIEVYELIQKIKIYNKSRREEISEILHGKIDENYIFNILYDFDEQDLGKKPLSKLKCDVYNFFEDEVSKKKEAEIY